MSTLIVVADLGRFKAFRVSKEPGGSRKIDLIASKEPAEAHEKLSERVTDTFGRFGRGEGAGGTAKGAGDPHSLEAEMEKRLIKLIAQEISAIVVKEGNPRWSFAASETIHGPIMELLSPGVKALVTSNLKINLTKASKEELLERF